MRLGGPKLRMPDLSAVRSKLPGRSRSEAGSTLKAPAFLNDLYYDLRDRRLLLPLALVLVAIAAVPFLLGSKPKPVPAPPGGGIAAAVGAGAEGGSKLTVVEAQPGLRDYQKRLKHRTPTDPFIQRHTGLPPAAQVQTTQSAGGGSESSGEGSVTVTESTTTEVTEGGGKAPSGGSSPSGEGGGESAAQKYEFVIDLQIAHSEKTADGKAKMSEWEARHDVPILAQLPGKKTSVVTLLGANYQKRRLVFLVSHAVKSISGEYGCVSRGEICELLEVAEGILLEFVYEPTGVTYAIKVTNASVIPKRKHGQSSRSARAAFMLANAVAKPQNFSK